MTDLNYRFPSKLRLKKASDFKKVFLNPVKSTDRYFTLLAINSDYNHPRLGLAIAKKIIRKAVHRNAIKRTVRESFRLEQQRLGAVDIVVLVRKEAVAAPLMALRKSLLKHWLVLASKCARSS